MALSSSVVLTVIVRGVPEGVTVGVTVLGPDGVWTTVVFGSLSLDLGALLPPLSGLLGVDLVGVDLVGALLPPLSGRLPPTDLVGVSFVLVPVLPPSLKNFTDLSPPPPHIR